MSAPIQLSMFDTVTTPSSSPIGLDVILPRQSAAAALILRSSARPLAPTSARLSAAAAAGTADGSAPVPSNSCPT